MDKEKGYSAYIFDDNQTSGYCIIDLEGKYLYQRLLMNICCVFLIFAIMFAVPVMLVTVYNDFREKVEKNDNMLFFVWSLAFVSFLAAILMFGYDIIHDC